MERRLAFGSVAELYDAARPSYPAELVDDVLAYTRGRSGRQVDPIDALEVGAGTGKATELFAARGLKIVAVEPSEAMAAVASRRAATASVTVRVTDFESAALTAHAFDLVYCAQAWHWVDPERRFGLARQALRDGGALAAFWNRADWDRCPLTGELTGAYDRSGVTLNDAGPMYPGEPTRLDLGDEWREQTAAEFADAVTRVYRWEQRYTAAEYVDLMATHSDHILLGGEARGRLFAEVAAVIDGHGGTLDLPYATLLCLARVT
jgi:SAM-dependent methyltransferase